MSFLAPGILWALAALAIPILLHLFFFRRFRRVAFSNVRFLREVKEETQRRSRLRNLLVLALRLLAFAAAVLAFAQPSWRDAERDAPEGAGPPARPHVALWVDNSFSMSAQAADVTLLARARQRASEIIDAYGERADYQVLTNDLDGASTRTLSADDARAAVADIRRSAASRPLASILPRVAAAASPGTTPELYALSDFQRSQMGEPATDSAVRARAVPLRAVAERNVSIDSVWLASPLALAGRPVRLIIRLTNHGDRDAEAVRLGVRLDGRTQPFGTRRVPAGSARVDTVTLAGLRAGRVDGTVEITDFPIEFDDRYHFSLAVRERLRALVIHGPQPSRYLRSAFPAGSAVELTLQPESRVNYSELGRQDLVVVDGLPTLTTGLAQALTDYLAGGGKVAIFPAATGAGGAYGQLLARAGLPPPGAPVTGEFRVGSVNEASGFFDGVFARIPRNLRLPQTRTRYALSASRGEPLLSFRDGRPALVRAAAGEGTLFVSALPLDPDVSDLVRNGEVFVPVLYRMAVSGASARPLAYRLGDASSAALTLDKPPGDAALRVRSADGEGVFVPQQRWIGNRVLLGFGEQPAADGHYRLVDPADSVLAHLAFNYDRRESPQRFLDDAELAAAGFEVYDGERAGALAADLQAATDRAAWWPWLVGLALLALLAESLVLRFWRPARTGGASAKTGASAEAAIARRPAAV